MADAPASSRVRRQRRGNGGAGFADIHDDRDTAADMPDGECGERHAFFRGQAYRFARMHRQRKPFRAMTDMKIQ